MSELLTTKELCQWLKITPNTANTYRREGMPYKQINKRVVRYDKEEVKKWLEKK